MGRRALRKKPAIDLSAHLRTLEELPRPWSAAAHFGRRAPLEIEVGSGKGLFLAAAAQADPARDFVGIEIERKYAAYAAGKLARAAVTNAFVLHGDAQRFVSEWLLSESADAVHIYFPDPWWKKRHKKRRVINERFVREIQRVLVPAGRLHFWTDVEEYFQVTRDLLSAHTSLAGPFDVPERQACHDLDYRTHFERRVRQAGETVYRAEYRKQRPAD